MAETRAADHAFIDLPEETPLRGGFSWHAVITLPPPNTGKQQTLFDLGEIGGPLRLTLFIDAEDILNARLVVAKKAEISVLCVTPYSNYSENQHVHVGAQIRAVRKKSRLDIYYQGNIVGSGLVKEGIGDKLIGKIALGEDLDGEHHVVRFHIARIIMWHAPLNKGQFAALWQELGDQFESILAPVGQRGDNG